MTTRDKTAIVTLRIQVPTFSPEDAVKKYLPQIIAAALAAEVPTSSTGLRLKGATVTA